MQTVSMPVFSHLVLLLRHLSHATAERILDESGRRAVASAWPVGMRGRGVFWGEASTVEGEAWVRGEGCCKTGGEGGRCGGTCG